MDPFLAGLLIFLGLLAVWAVTETALSVLRRRRIERDPWAVWRGGRKMLPEDAKRIGSLGGSTGGTDRLLSPNTWDSGIH